MRKVLLAVSVMAVVAAIFVLCNQNGFVNNKSSESETEQEATTVIVDEEGTTHYYKIVSDVSQGAGSTTVITPDTTTSADDNNISFDNTDELTTAARTVSEAESTISYESPTDSDGWIDRWY